MPPNPPPLPTADALTLSATLFHSSIDSWLPPSFGLTRSETEKARDFDAALRSSAARNVRLGLGHPDLDDPARRAKLASQRAGIDALTRKVGGSHGANGSMEAGGPSAAANMSASEVDQDSESRSALGKAKKRSVDMFASKKSKPKLAPVAPVDSLSRPVSAVSGSTPTAQDPVSRQPSIPNMSTKQLKMPESLLNARKRPRDDTNDDDGDEHGNASGAVSAQMVTAAATTPSTCAPTPTPIAAASDGGAGAGDSHDMSKTQLRREKRKRAKLQKQRKAD